MNSVSQNLSGYSLSDAQRIGRNFLSNCGSATPDLDSRLLLQEICGLSHETFVSNFDQAVSAENIRRFHGYLERCRHGEPVHRILGWREFFGRKFLVSKNTLLPRPDTELLVDTALDYLDPQSGRKRVLEIGTGSGIVAISIALETRLDALVATDVSNDALIVAKRNATRHRVNDVIRFMNADLVHGIVGEFDLIVSNPPYIPRDDIDGLDDGVRLHDPILALDGGKDGLKFFNAIFASAKEALNVGGLVILEMGYGQCQAVKDLSAVNGYEVLEIREDLSGIERVLVARKA